MKRLVLLLVLVLAGCSAPPIPPSTPMPDGAMTVPPPQYLDYCQRHQEDTGCPR